MTSFSLNRIESEADYLACFAVMRILRPHFADAASFVSQVKRQATQGYRLLAARQDGEVVALAGYRQLENLLYGRFVYIDDLVVAPDARSHGVGERLISAVRAEAIEQGCTCLVLDTAAQNALAQRFYFRQGLLLKGLHFSQSLVECAA